VTAPHDFEAPGEFAAPEGFAAFDDAVAAFLQEYFSDDPTTATFLGRTEWDHQLPDLTAAGFERREAATKGWLERFSSFEASDLSLSQQVDQALCRAYLGARVATAGFSMWRRDATAYLGNGIFELFVHGNRPQAEATEAAIDRLALVPDGLEAGRQNLDPALVDGELMRQWGIPNVKAQSVFMRQGLGVFVDDAGLRARLQAAGEVAAVAYDAFADFLAELADRATGTFVFGEENYDARLRIGEGFNFGARELRQMGRQQMELLDEQMSTLAETIGGTKDWRAVVTGLRNDHATDMDDLLRCYREETAKARQFVRDHGIMTMPDGEECAVEPAPLFRRSSAPVASYFPPPYYGPAGQGTFNVPFTPDGASAQEQEARLRSNSFFEIPGVTAHEAYPGHHLHYAVARQTNALRQVLGSVYMSEGWGLYVEQMMGQHGYYEDDAARLGQLSMRMFRAGRIVVDTSLHMGEMTREEATTFMSERCGFPEPTARGEVLRYCSWPTQASAYLTGALEIERMAGEWVEAGKGTLAQFHDALTASGKLPLGVAAQAIGLQLAPG
jgi:uncharacterized protein (DUF885 family)